MDETLSPPSKQEQAQRVETTNVTRRTFLMGVGIALNAAVGLVIATPVVAYLLGPVLRRKEYLQWIAIGNVSDFAFDKKGNWVKTWGSRGSGGAHANENPGQFNTPHNIGIDRQNNIYVAVSDIKRIMLNYATTTDAVFTTVGGLPSSLDEAPEKMKLWDPA